jgi:MFS family permease
MGIDLIGYATLGVATPIWMLAALYLVQGAAIGVSMPAATSAVMDVLPRERAGAGSALTNTARQVAVALSVAILGSILAVFYRNALSPSLTHLPAAARAAASSSITATQAVAQQLGTAGLALAGGFEVLRWMPGRPAKVRPASAASDSAYEDELAILEEAVMLNSAEREG